MKTVKLYDALNAADLVIVDGCGIDEFVYEDLYRLGCGEDSQWTFPNQDIHVAPRTEAILAKDVDGKEVVVELRKVVLLDLTTLPDAEVK